MLIDLVCLQCSCDFHIDEKYIKYGLKRGRTCGKFCSTECSGRYNTEQNTKLVLCTHCGKEFVKHNNQFKKSKSGNNFCGSSCAATYNNRHKTTGNRRSKLEAHIEGVLRSTFPKLEIIANSTSLIDYELDFYFPELKLALEINGIFHYKPIYGEEKLKRIQNNDNNKIKLCKDKNIKLIIYKDNSIRFSSKNAEICWEEIKEMLLPYLYGRGKL